MNIYIETEIRAREFEKNLLLGVVAASRGHNVLVGRMNNRLSDGDLSFLPPGIYHDKSLVPDSAHRRKHRILERRGFVITCQDEEHGLIRADYSRFAETRFAPDLLKSVHRVFTWGPHDHNGLQSSFPGFIDKFVMAGSPRIDLLSSKFKGHREWWADRHHVPKEPFLLIVSNLGGPMDMNSLPARIQKRRASGALVRPAEVLEAARRDESTTMLLRHYLSTIHELAATRRIPIVVRPHPTESVARWRALLGDCTGVTISDAGPLSAWLERSTLALQNGCTSAYEGALIGSRVLSFTPEGIGADLRPNALGYRVSTTAEIRNAVEAALDPNGGQCFRLDGASKILESLFAQMSVGSAVDKVLEVWESSPAAGGSSRAEGLISRPSGFVRSKLTARLRRGLHGSRAGVRSLSFAVGGTEQRGSELRFVTSHKFPPLDLDEVRDMARSLGEATGLNTQVTVRRVDERIVWLHA